MHRQAVITSYSSQPPTAISRGIKWSFVNENVFDTNNKLGLKGMSQGFPQEGDIKVSSWLQATFDHFYLLRYLVDLNFISD